MNRLKDSLKVLDDMKKAEDMVASLKDYVSELKAPRLKELCSFKKIDSKEFNKKSTKGIKKVSQEDGLFPKISHIIEDLQSKVEIQDDIPLPKRGVMEEVDEILDQMDDHRNKLNSILEKMRKSFKCQDIVFVSSRQKFELEFPEKVIEE